MTNRERILAVLNYEKYDRIPVIHFGFWNETLTKWKDEGHLTSEVLKDAWDGSANQKIIGDLLGFDSSFSMTLHNEMALSPCFETIEVGKTPDGFRKVRNHMGVIELHRGDATGIPAEIDHLLKDRESWEEHFKAKLQPGKDRIYTANLDYFKENRPQDTILHLYAGSLFGAIRDMMGVEGISYLYADDEELFVEIIDTVGNLCYEQTKMILALANERGLTIDCGHFWEDICYKNGPLVIPSVFHEVVGPHYKKITSLLNQNGINLISLDCDGWIDSLIPTWFNNGVNIMFPIEVGTWRAEITPWREKYGKELRGVGGMDKTIFAHDYKAVDQEIERLKPLIALGGFIPCPDHRIAPDAKWENVQYYCERMKREFS